MKVTLTFRGREVYHPDLGKKILDKVEEAVKDVGRVEIFPRIDGRNMTMVLTPDKRAQAAAQKAAAAAARRGERRCRRRRAPRHRAAATEPGATEPHPEPPSPSPPPSPEPEAPRRSRRTERGTTCPR